MLISREMVSEMVEHAYSEAPNECCGIIATDGERRAVRLYRTANVSASPLRYSLDPQEQYRIQNEIEESGFELGAIYHSHTHTPAYPSPTDISLAFYPDAVYLIVSLDGPTPEVKGFRIVEGAVTEERLVVE